MNVVVADLVDSTRGGSENDVRLHSLSS
jgi:hypothetical protein